MESDFTRKLYQIFEEKLLTLALSDAPSQENFIEDVVDSYVEALRLEGHYIIESEQSEVTEELRAEVLAMTRKKTYGFFDLKEYATAQLKRGLKRS